MPTLLLVEADPAQVRVHARVLRRYAPVAVAASLQSARALLDTTSLQGVVIDLNLPDGLGFELVADARRRHPRVPILLIASQGDHDTLARATALGLLFGLKSGVAVLRTFASACVAGGDTGSHTRLRGAVDVRRFLAPFGLTPRELEVVEYASLGLGRAEVASRLSLSESTCAYHVANVLSNTGQPRMSKLVAWLRTERAAGGE